MPAKNEGVAKSTTNPYSGTRAQNIENAKAAGEFEGIRKDYNQRNKTTGHSMNENGDIDYNAANNLQGRQSLIEQTPRMWDTSVRSGQTAGGKSASSTSAQQVARIGTSNGPATAQDINNARQVSGTASIPNPYGTAKATYNEATGPRPQSMVQNAPSAAPSTPSARSTQNSAQPPNVSGVKDFNSPMSTGSNPYQAPTTKPLAEGIPSFFQTRPTTPKQAQNQVEEMAKLAEESEDEGEEGGEEGGEENVA